MTKKAAAARRAGAGRCLGAAPLEQKVSLVRSPGASAPSATKATPAPSASAARPATPPRSQPAAAPSPAAKRPVTPPPAPPARAVSRATTARPATATARARSAPPIEQQYAYVKGDLRLIGALAAVMFIVIIALHYVLPS
jgi:hypothetical protein